MLSTSRKNDNLYLITSEEFTLSNIVAIVSDCVCVCVCVSVCVCERERERDYNCLITAASVNIYFSML